MIWIVVTRQRPLLRTLETSWEVKVPQVQIWMDARGVRITADTLKEISPTVTKIYMLGNSRTVLQALKAGTSSFNSLYLAK